MIYSLRFLCFLLFNSLHSGFHVGAMLKARTDPDFVPFRPSNGIPLKHAKPPATQDAIEELAKQ